MLILSEPQSEPCHMERFAKTVRRRNPLDPKLSFDEHTQCILIKTRKIIRLIRTLQPIIQRAALLTIYKFFFRPHLDYGDVIFDRAFNKSFQNKYQAIRGSSREKLYQELSLELLKSRCRYLKLCLFFKLKKNKHSSYLFDMVPKVLSTQTTRNIATSLYLMLNKNSFENLFFRPLLLSGISSIIIFEIRNWLVLFKNKSFNLSDQVLIVRLLCLILMELNCLQGYELG